MNGSPAPFVVTVTPVATMAWCSRCNFKSAALLEARFDGAATGGYPYGVFCVRCDKR